MEHGGHGWLSCTDLTISSNLARRVEWAVGPLYRVKLSKSIVESTTLTYATLNHSHNGDLKTTSRNLTLHFEYGSGGKTVGCLNSTCLNV